MKPGVIIPAYNEVGTISGVVASVSHVGTIIVIDDGSSDDTAKRARDEGAVVIVHEKNLGYDQALQTGFECAVNLGLDMVVTFDADGQHEASAVGQFIEILNQQQAELVLGSRKSSARFAEAIFNIYGYLRFGVPDLLCGLKGYRTNLYIQHGPFDGADSVGTALALASMRSGASVQVVPVQITPRRGRSRFGSIVGANVRILKALMQAIRQDLFILWNFINR